MISETDAVNLQDITLTNVNMWSKTGSAVIKCESAFGSGACLRSGSPTSCVPSSLPPDSPIYGGSQVHRVKHNDQAGRLYCE